MKVFGIGFHKTGTTSLGMALRVLGYNVCGLRKDLLDTIIKHKYQPVYNVIDEFDAFQDNPWPLLYRTLDIKYPGSKFILTYRNEENWIKSVLNHFGHQNTEMRKWIYGVGCPKDNEEVFVNKYRNHNRSVLEYFKDRENDFISLSLENGDNWAKLCNFLNKPIPNKPFPHARRGYYSKIRWLFQF